MGKWRAEGRYGLQGTDWSVTEWVPNPNPKRPGKYKWVAEVRDRKTAELIETAPELLAALEGLVEMLDSPRPHIQKARLQCRAKAALKKAKGMGKRLEEWAEAEELEEYNQTNDAMDKMSESMNPVGGE
tara:strand:- start:3545 stop:3931 length:387 start_codon:yes stop_codon:yes gene_type:complete